MGKFSFSDPCWNLISDKAKALITKLLTYDPDQRPSADEALKNPWITEMSTVVVDSNIAMCALSNLKNFRGDQKLKQATFAFIASQLLTKNEKENMAKIFKVIDKKRMATVSSPKRRSLTATTSSLARPWRRRTS